MARFNHRNMALVLALVMTAIAIATYNMLSLALRHHHAMMHDIHHVIAALILCGAFYGVIRYMQALPDEDE